MSQFRKTSFILDPFSADSKAIVVVERAATGILDGSVRIESPLNTKLNMQRLGEKYTYCEQVAKVSVWFSTQRCPTGTYSIRRGIHSGYSVKALVNCHPCPVGGNCSSSLAAQPNLILGLSWNQRHRYLSALSRRLLLFAISR